MPIDEQCTMCNLPAIAVLQDNGRSMKLCGGHMLMAADAPGISEQCRREILEAVSDAANAQETD